MILAEDRGTEAKDAVVGEFDGVLIIADAHDGHHGTEGFLAHDCHAVVNIDKDGRLEEIAAGTTFATNENFGTFLDGIGDQVLDLSLIHI